MKEQCSGCSSHAISSQKPVAIICAKGIGDALIFMIIAYHLFLNKIPVILYSNALKSFQSWFPYVCIETYPEIDKIDAWRATVGQIICGDHPLEALPVIRQSAIFFGKPQFDRKETVVKNVLHFCKTQLHLENVTKENGIVIPSELKYRHYPKRVVIHPESSDPLRKNWPAKKFHVLACRLRKQGFEPVFTVAPSERAEWQAKFPGESFPEFPSLADLGAFVYESGSMIGNDSGIGHIASLLNIPTLSIFSRKSTSFMWRPDWRRGEIIYPWISLRPFRKQWRSLVSVGRVERAFLKLNNFPRP